MKGWLEKQLKSKEKQQLFGPQTIAFEHKQIAELISDLRSELSPCMLVIYLVFLSTEQVDYYQIFPQTFSSLILAILSPQEDCIL